MRTAILITGRLRMADVNASALEALSRRHDVFVCAASCDRELLVHLGPVRECLFVEDDPFQRSLQDHLLELPEGEKLLQWHKLFVAFRMVEDAERALGMRYDRVYKLRTDLVFAGDVLEDLQRHECRPDVIYSRSDWYFGGSRDVMERACGFLIPAMTAHYDRHREYLPVDLTRLSERSFEAGPLHRIKLPSSVVGTPQTLDDRRRAMLANREAISAVSDRGAAVSHGQKNPHVFPSEPAFMVHLLNLGLIVEPFSNRVYWPHPLRFLESWPDLPPLGLRAEALDRLSAEPLHHSGRLDAELAARLGRGFLSARAAGDGDGSSRHLAALVDLLLGDRDAEAPGWLRSAAIIAGLGRGMDERLLALSDLSRRCGRPDEFAAVVARLRSICGILKPPADLARSWIGSVHRLLEHAAAMVPACGEEGTRSDLQHIQAVLAGTGLPGPEEIGGLLRVGRSEPAAAATGAP